MNFRFYIIATSFYFVVLSFNINAQWTREDDSVKVWFTDGIYSSQESFFNNKPDYKWVNPNEVDWRYKDSIRRTAIFLSVNQLAHDEGSVDVKAAGLLAQRSNDILAIEMNKIWGFCLHGNPYIHIEKSTKENFIRIPVLGIVSYLTYSEQVDDQFMTSDMMTGNMGGYTEIRQLIVDFEKSRIISHNKGNLEEILARDLDLYTQYNNEKRRSREIYRYIKMYNDKHPISFK